MLEEEVPSLLGRVKGGRKVSVDSAPLSGSSIERLRGKWQAEQGA